VSSCSRETVFLFSFVSSICFDRTLTGVLYIKSSCWQSRYQSNLTYAALRPSVGVSVLQEPADRVSACCETTDAYKWHEALNTMQERSHHRVSGVRGRCWVADFGRYNLLGSYNKGLVAIRGSSEYLQNSKSFRRKKMSMSSVFTGEIVACKAPSHQRHRLVTGGGGLGS
jgi:hypothetical protein